MSYLQIEAESSDSWSFLLLQLHAKEYDPMHQLHQYVSTDRHEGDLLVILHYPTVPPTRKPQIEMICLKNVESRRKAASKNGSKILGVIDDRGNLPNPQNLECLEHSCFRKEKKEDLLQTQLSSPARVCQQHYFWGSLSLIS